MPDLTPEQSAIVAHDHGPALVFAVAGAGKTTAVVHRIERLVREEIFAPPQILATSFSRASVRDIQIALGRWSHCASVRAGTLHAVGWGLLRRAQARGHLPAMDAGQDEDGGQEAWLLSRTLSRAWRDRADFAPELDGLDRQDFLSYVGACKANLLYADLARADLPPLARDQAGQAPAPAGMEWYLDLYRLYERVRREENRLTFDDMLVAGWECLHRFPDVLAEARSRFGCVLVDEFQDVSLVQSEILDLLTYPHRNYMAVGDDDQTIYEWRGARPDFILGFAGRYGARKYLISDNFRSHAAHLALANRVIERNTKREPKRLSLTRGFGGGVHIHQEHSPEHQGRHLAQLVREALAAGRSPGEIVVLVRLYAQTPFIEQALTEEGLPYHVVGAGPFYQRPEVQTLLDYLRLAGMERDQPMLHATSADAAERRCLWERVANRPTRYLNAALVESIAKKVGLDGGLLSQALQDAASQAPDRTAFALHQLSETLIWLAQTLDNAPAGEVLGALDKRLGYTSFLRRASGFPETGAARAAGVEAFLSYATGKGTPAQFLAHLERLHADQVGRNAMGAGEAISLMTVFRAKGLQWPIVFVPDCNQGVFPCGGPNELEEERRLFYVALTRPTTDLHLHVVRTERPSQFLIESGSEETLAAVAEVKAALGCGLSAWGTAEALAVARHTRGLGLERYFHAWWDAPPDQALSVAHRIQRLFHAARRRGLLGPLGLTDESLAVWERFGRLTVEAEEDGFTDLESFAPATEDGAPPEPLPRERRAGEFAVGDRVRHAAHGEGTVLSVRSGFGSAQVTVQFGKGSPVTLRPKFVQAAGA